MEGLKPQKTLPGPKENQQLWKNVQIDYVAIINPDLECMWKLLSDLSMLFMASGVHTSTGTGTLSGEISTPQALRGGWGLGIPTPQPDSPYMRKYEEI